MSSVLGASIHIFSKEAHRLYNCEAVMVARFEVGCPLSRAPEYIFTKETCVFFYNCETNKFGSFH